MDFTIGAQIPGLAGGAGVGAPGGTPAGPKPAEAGASEVERFQAAYNPQESAAEVAAPPEAVSDPAGAEQASSAIQEQAASKANVPASVGDRILQGLGAVSDRVQVDRAQAIETLQNKDATQADLLRASFGMLESANIITGVTKTAEKVNQGIKTLQQG